MLDFVLRLRPGIDRAMEIEIERERGREDLAEIDTSGNKERAERKSFAV